LSSSNEQRIYLSHDNNVAHSLSVYIMCKIHCAVWLGIGFGLYLESGVRVRFWVLVVVGVSLGQ